MTQQAWAQWCRTQRVRHLSVTCRPPALGVSSFLVALGAEGVPGTLGCPGVLGVVDGLDAGGPIGAEPEPVAPGVCFGSSDPGAFVPGCDPGTGEAGCASADPHTSIAAAESISSLDIERFLRLLDCSDNGHQSRKFLATPHATRDAAALPWRPRGC